MASSSYHEYIAFAQRIGLVGGTNFFIGMLQLILIPVLTKNLPITDYGVWVQLTVVMGLIPSVILLGLPYTMVRFLAAESSRDEIREGFYSILGVIFCTSLITSIVLLIFSEYLATVLFNGNVFAVRILAIVVFFECMISIVISIFRTFQQIKRYSLLMIFKNLSYLIFICLFIFLHYGIDGAVIGILISDIISFLIIYYFIFKEIGFFVPHFTKIKEYLAFGIPTLPSNFSSWIIMTSNRFFIGTFLGINFVGYFNPGVQLANTLSMFASPLSFILPAALSKYYDEQKPEKVRILLEYSLKFLLLIAIPAAFGLSVLSKPLLTIFSTPTIASEGFLVTPIIAFGQIFMCLYIILMQILILEKKTMITAKVWICAAIFNLVLNLLLIPIFGIVGAALTYFLTILLVLIVIFVLTKKYISFNLNLHSVGKYIVASLLMSALVLVFYPKTIEEIGLYICGSVLIYIVSIFFLKAVKIEEILFIKKLVVP